MTHTQNPPPDNESGAPYAKFWELHTQRAEPEYVGKPRHEQTVIGAPKLPWWGYLLSIAATAAVVVALVWLYSIAPLGGVA